MKQKILIIFILLCLIGCQHRSRVDITPHPINPEAHIYYRMARGLHASYDGGVEARLQALEFLDNALRIDSLNPHYYGLKARIFTEWGFLDPALAVQTRAYELGAMNGDYYFQLGLLQAARGMDEEARENFRRSDEFLREVVRQHPDSLLAFVKQRAAHALYMGDDALFMPDRNYVWDRFPDRGWELVTTQSLRPSELIIQVLDIERLLAERNLNILSEIFENDAERPAWMEYLENSPPKLE